MRKSLRLITAAAAFAVLQLGSSINSFAQEQSNEGMGTIFTKPEYSPDLVEDEPEMSSDIEFFAAAGYTVPDFNVYYNLRHDVAKEVVVPDFVKRTGQVPPDDARVEVAAAYLTGGDFNDLVVYSFLPGDCGDGCLAQVYRTTDGVKWKKVLEFTSLAFAFKSPSEDKQGEVVAVGNDDMPNRIYQWNGISFVEKK
ncbi:hypothetical protein OIU34_16995 [Pararhizobium sp. BT-229]|uniref:hypothetical protein n=1 Tax=Pararhizobium sp. BT-229 TaxID=2986923 RepID=UPI0021F7E51A|nr:hypothetical protein [Pararhizobium sp. BT-229]MCV9963598.1 hypothetical protein [Pararhizobium sp. BT-229]